MHTVVSKSKRMVSPLSHSTHQKLKEYVAEEQVTPLLELFPSDQQAA